MTSSFLPSKPVDSDDERDLPCSARQCTEVAQWAVIWSNPQIHHAREKIWLACPGHRDFLKEFVALRSFPHRVVPISDLDT